MALYKYVKESFEKGLKEKTPLMKERLVEWRKESSIERIERPTNLSRAREIGYKAKKEYVVARVKIDKGRRSRYKPDQGRKPAKRVKRVSPGMSLQRIAEGRVARRFSNMKVLGSYLVGEDGNKKYFEVVLYNPHSSKPRTRLKK